MTEAYRLSQVLDNAGPPLDDREGLECSPNFDAEAFKRNAQELFEAAYDPSKVIDAYCPRYRRQDAVEFMPRTYHRGFLALCPIGLEDFTQQKINAILAEMYLYRVAAMEAPSASVRNELIERGRTEKRLSDLFQQAQTLQERP